ncbi:hypothetical protein WJX82_001995 [Trebouxia sp. C0006]
MCPAVQQTCHHFNTAPVISQVHSCRTFGRSSQPPKLLRRSRKPKRIAAQDRQVDSEAPGNPLFANNPQFAAAFSQAVTRQGDEAVFSGAAAAPTEERTSPHEDMLLSSLQVPAKQQHDQWCWQDDQACTNRYTAQHPQRWLWSCISSRPFV